MASLHDEPRMSYTLIRMHFGGPLLWTISTRQDPDLLRIIPEFKVCFIPKMQVCLKSVSVQTFSWQWVIILHNLSPSIPKWNIDFARHHVIVLHTTKQVKLKNPNILRRYINISTFKFRHQKVVLSFHLKSCNRRHIDIIYDRKFKSKDRFPLLAWY
jgi:hypothetical protein